MDKYIERVYIYGIFDNGTNECLYIGQTVNPKKRFEQHKNPTRGRFKDMNVSMKIMNRCSLENSGNTELKFILHYRSIGQAKYNRRIVSITYSKKGTAYTIEHNGIIFDGLSQLARYLGWSQATVVNHINEFLVKGK